MAQLSIAESQRLAIGTSSWLRTKPLKGQQDQPTTMWFLTRSFATSRIKVVAEVPMRSKN